MKKINKTKFKLKTLTIRFCLPIKDSIINLAQIYSRINTRFLVNLLTLDFKNTCLLITVAAFKHKVWIDLVLFFVLMIFGNWLNPNISHTEGSNFEDLFAQVFHAQYTINEEGTVTSKFSEDSFSDTSSSFSDEQDYPSYPSSSPEKVEANSDLQLFFKQSPNVLIDNFFNEVLVKYPLAPEQQIESLKYVEKTFPKDIWAKTEVQLKDETYPINMFQDSINNNANFKNEIQLHSWIILRASISTYNALLLNDRADLSDEVTLKIAVKVMDNALEKIIELYTT